MNAIDLEIARNLFESIAEEMGTVLMRSAFSSNIRERLDFSCALFDKNAEMVAQAAHIPVHLGSTPASVGAAIERVPVVEGEDIILNDPYAGGTHLPDVTLIRPIFFDGELAMFACNRAHHADIGGKIPGSMGVTTDLRDEGFVIAPQPFTKELGEEIAHKAFTPQERLGDLKAQVAANARGDQRVIELLTRRPELLNGVAGLQAHSEQMMRKTLAPLSGVGEATDQLDDDGVGTRDIAIQCRVEIENGRAVVDFRGSDPECAGPLNVPRAVTESAVYYAFRCLAPRSLPTNGGYMRCIEVITERSIVDASFPRPVALGNVETSQRIVDVVFAALAQFIPDRIPASSYGSMNNVIFSGQLDNTNYAYYETIGGGAGASAELSGASAVQCHMTNTLNTPVESLERDYPVRILQYAVRSGSAGAGHQTGGNGIVREYEFLHRSNVCVMGERRLHPPRGLFGGDDAAVAIATLNGEVLDPKVCFDVEPGDRLKVMSAGGGGHGGKT